MIRRILKTMKQLLDVHRFVTMVNARADELEAEHVGKDLDQILDNWHPTISIVKERYKTKYKVGQNKVNGIYDDATDEWHYLETIDKKMTGKKGTFELPFYVKLTPKGRRFLDTYPFIPFIPKGLVKAWWEDDKVLIKLLLVAIVAAVSYAGTGLAVTLIKVIIRAA